MKQVFQILEFNKIIDQLKELAITNEAKEQVENIHPYLSERDLMAALRDTTEARKLLDSLGTPPIPTMEGDTELIEHATKGGMLLVEQIETIGVTLSAIKRLKSFLKRGQSMQIGLSYRSDDLDPLEEVRENVLRMIRNGKIDDYATDELKDIRKNITLLNEKIRIKAEALLKSNKQYCSESFIVNRNGHICLPVKKEHKLKVSGSVIDKSSTSSTFFIEPVAIANLVSELQSYQLEEENEERKILYTLSALIADHSDVFFRNKSVVVELDYMFAKGKLSVEQKASEPLINTNRIMKIEKGRHPLLDRKVCVPLDFEIGNDNIRGVIITGPNTGGKTVAIKTVGLLSLMAQCGLHIPCEYANICMNNQVLCDIGDGQNIMENLSTFSGHITNILDILSKVSEESFVVLDELGSGTDPTEGMGIAIAILEELRKSGCLFVVTTHYPEVKEYAKKEEGIMNARMAFDRETLKPMYRLEIGKAGESCALYIADKLGMPYEMIKSASMWAYGKEFEGYHKDKEGTIIQQQLKKEHVSKIQKVKEQKEVSKRAASFHIGDCVMIYPNKSLGIVAKKANQKGEIVVQLKKKKIVVNHKRLKLHVAAEEMYPEDYDFSVIFDTVQERKARKKLEKGAEIIKSSPRQME